MRSVLCEISPRVLIVGGAAIFSVMTFFIILFIILFQKRYYHFLNEKLRLQNIFRNELLKTQLETQEETFYMIGEEIHDNIGQLLSSTKLLLGITERNMPIIPDPFKTAQETLGKAISELRALSKSLNKEWLHQFNLIQNLETEIARVNSIKELTITLSTNLGNLPLPAESQVMLFRIVQEALQNAIKHAMANSIQVSIEYEEQIKVTILDDGLGLSKDKNVTKGVGIINMTHRTNLLSGTINWSSRPEPERGTEVKIIIPVKTDNYAH